MPSSGIGSKLIDLGGGAQPAAATKTYWFYANDTSTAITPIIHGANATNTFLTNNNLGTRTFEYNPDSKANLWNPATNKFDFSSLKIGDIVDIRVDLVIDHNGAQEVNLVMDLAEGEPSPYTLNVSHDYYKTASLGITVTAQFKLPFIGQETVDGGARLRLTSKASASIVVEGWYYEVTQV